MRIFMRIWCVAIIVLCFCGAAAAATVEIYPISYTDGFTPAGGRGVSIILPSSYREGDHRKWVIYLHGMGEDGVLLTNTAFFTALVDKYGIILVTINSDPNNIWWDTDLWPAHHLEEGIALARQKHDLTAYLPCLYGVSAGATKALTEMQQHPGLYSCFAASSIASDSIAMAEYSPIAFDNLWGSSVFGGNHDSVDETVHARWVMYSPAQTVHTADMGGRKVYIVHGSADSITSATYQYTPFVSAIPAANLANATLVSGGGHSDYLANATYADGFFSFFRDNSVASVLINGHTVVLDGTSKIIPWTTDPSQGYDQVMDLAWTYLLNNVPNDSQNHKPDYYSHSYLNPDTQQPADWPHDQAGLYAMLAESALKYYGYSGNIAVVNLAENVAIALLNNGMTPSGWNWPGVPYACGDSGSLIYQGAAVGNSNGVGDGQYVIEPDKVGEMGYAWLQLYRFDGNVAFLNAAIAAADVLASHVRVGSATQSPWPFRVYAQTGVVREDYCADVIGPISLFDGLINLGLGNIAAYQAARATAWNWMMTYPMQNNVWANYFEDVPIQTNRNNLNQYNALMTARYLLEHPEYDASWESHVRGLITWVKNTFRVPSYGADTIQEQVLFAHPMGSHTSRHASVNALLYEKTGDTAAKETAYRSLNWATYMARTNGVVIDGPEVNHLWFTDGYGDYIRHFMTSLGAVPEWAPAGENHLVRSSSIVKDIIYAQSSIAYTTADENSMEVLRVNFTPSSVTVDGQALSQRSDLTQAGWTFDPVLNVLRIRHDAGTNVQISQTISLNAPIVMGTTPTNDTTPTWTWVTGGGGNGTYRYKLDNSDMSTGTTTTTNTSFTPVTALAETSHTLYVQERNAAGSWSTSGSSTIVIDTTAPNTSITSQPANPTNLTSANFTFTATETATFECQMDNGGYATCASPKAYSSLASNQTHTFNVRATDLAENTDPSPAAYAWIIDTAVPNAPTVTGTTPTNDTTPTWTWVSGGGGNGTYRYKLDSSDMSAGTTTTTNTTYTPLAQSEGTHTLYVQERDAAGNWSASGSSAIVIDTAAPNTSIIGQPTNPTNQTSASFGFSSTEAGSTFQCSIDGQAYSACTSTTTYSSLATNQTHTFTVRAIDLAGNIDATPATYSWVIDTNAPDTSITGKPTNPTNQTSASFGFSSTEAGSTFQCSIDGQTYSACTSTTTYSGLATNQTHTFNVRAIDLAGNMDATPATYSWVIDTNAPDTSITGKPTNPTNQTSASFGFSSSEAGSTFQCSIDGQAYSACTSTTTYSGLATNQTHTFNVRATDPVGNTDASPATYAWTIDTIAPDTSITGQPTNPANQTTASFTFSATESATFECQMDNGGYTACTSQKAYSNLASNQTHTFSVRATDLAGNTDATPATYAWMVDSIAPDTSIIGQPANPTSQTSANFAFTATETANFACQIDNTGYSACTSPKAYSNLASNQTHTFNVRATDPAGNTEVSPATYVWMVDTTAPDTSIIGQPANPTNQTNASFTFTATETANFECQIDSTGYSACTSPKTYGNLVSNQTHTFNVRAIDLAGNTDATPATYAWMIDTSALGITLSTTAPNPTRTSPIPVTVTFSKPVTDFVSSDVTVVNGSMTNGSFEGSGDTYNFTMTPSGDGLVTLSIAAGAAHDEAGNANGIDSLSISYDTTAPGSPAVTGMTPTNSTTPTWTWGSGGGGNGTYRFKLDNSDLTTGATTTTSTSYTPSALAEGTHTLYAQERDAAGNWSASGNFAIAIDITAPNTSIASQPANLTNQTSASFTFSATETAIFECRMDNGGYSACTSPKSYTLAAGSHTFQVRAIDLAGNIDATPATYAWMIDTTAPDTSILSQPANPTSETSASFTFSATETTIFECQMDSGGYSACSSPKSYTLTAGSHAFQVRAIDLAGNIDATPATYTWNIDTSAPNAPVVAGTTPTNSTTPTWTWMPGGGGIGAYRFRLDNIDLTTGATATTNTSYTPLALTEGTHTLYVQERDAAGNWSASGSSAIVIDITTPDTSITDTAGQPNKPDEREFHFHGNGDINLRMPDG